MAQEIETRRLNEDFVVELDDLIGIVEDYRGRKFDEDIKSIKQNYDGIEGLAQKLRTSFQDGLKGDDFDDRTIEFGNNK